MQFQLGENLMSNATLTATTSVETLTVSKACSLVLSKSGGESICGKGDGGIQAGPNDDPGKCGDCSAKGNIESVSASRLAMVIFGFNPFMSGPNDDPGKCGDCSAKGN